MSGDPSPLCDPTRSSRVQRGTWHRRSLAVLLTVAGSAGLSIGQPPDNRKNQQRSSFSVVQAAQSGNSAGTWFDLSNRAAVRDEYLNRYQPLASVPIGWTGNGDACQAGDTSPAYKDAVLGRVNYFRRMAGVAPIAAFNPTYNAQNQQGALMISVNRFLTNSPPPGWKCYTQDGRDGLYRSNVCYLGKNDDDPGCVATYVKNDGLLDSSVKQRRLLLFPKTLQMATGDVPANALYYKASALWVWDDLNWGKPRPATREAFVAWPPPGFVPKQLTFRRWSFSYPLADFYSATVQMFKTGAQVPVTIEPYAMGWAENTLVWATPESFVNEMNDVVGDVPVTVRVSNVIVNGVPQDFNYTVTVFEPEVSGAPGTVPVRVTTVPLGIPVTVDGATAPSPRVFEWVPGSSHRLEVTATTTTTDLRATFVSWNPGGTQRVQNITAPSAPTVFTAMHQAQFRLTRNVIPPEGGKLNVNPDSPDGFYAAGDNVYLWDEANPNFRFVSFLGDKTGLGGGETIRMTSPQNITGIFSRLDVPVTFKTVPRDREIRVDGVNTLPKTFYWLPGSTHTIEADLVQPEQSGTRHIFQSWSNQGPRVQTITVPDQGAEYTATFKTQVQLTVSVSPTYGGTVLLSPSSPDNYYDVGAQITVTAQPAAGYRFTGFGYAVSGTANPQNYVVTNPNRIHAEFQALNGAPILFHTDPPGLPLTIDGVQGFASLFFQWPIGSSHTVEAPAQVVNGERRYNFNRWSQGGGRVQSIIVPAGQTQYTAYYDSQYLLTTEVSPPTGGSLIADPASADGFYNPGTRVTMRAIPSPGYTFTGFTNALSGALNPQAVVMSEPRFVRAVFGPANPGSSIPYRFVPITPCRAVDTRREDWRNTSFGPPSMSAGETRAFQLPLTSCGIPTGVGAYSLNVTVVPSGPLSYLTVWPLGLSRPLVSTLNSFDGRVVANAAIVPAGSDGRIAVFVTDRTDVVIDINGFFLP